MTQNKTTTAAQVAREVAKRTGKACDGKRVRSYARAFIARFDDDGYTSHQYSAAEHKRIVDALVARAKGTTGTNGRARSAAQGRAGAPKTAPKRKASTFVPATPIKAPSIVMVPPPAPVTPDPVA